MFIKKLLLPITTVIVAAALLISVLPAQALSGNQFNSGRIIDDTVFFNPNLATAAQIQTFLSSKVPTCDTNGSQSYAGTTRAAYGASRGYPAPYTCLKDYSMNIPGVGADQYCTGSISGGTKSAAQIIYDVAQACNISPQVLLVTLQKEQSLVTDDWPWPVQYEKALGYACPDTAPCSPEFAGLFNQLYYAARQFQRYAKQPQLFNYRGGVTSFVGYNPNTGCGGSNITMQSQATAGLYNYTPYQPNAAALDNLYGTGDGCSAYGNRNFWRMFNDWFGSTYFQQALISFKSHVSNTGWGDNSVNGGITGTVGMNRPMEAFKVNGDVEYTSYNYTTGWQPTVSRGMISGTTGQLRSVQAIKINPTGTLATQYDIWYRAHVSNIGWMDWTKNGSAAGITGDAGKNIEAFEIKLTSKDAPSPDTTTTPYINSGVVTYSPSLALSVSSHASNVGWQPTVVDSMVSGTTEQARRLEAIKVGLTNTTGYAGSVNYSSHVAGIGWQDIKADNDISGTTGQQRQLEAFRMTLTGELGSNYDVWYRAHVATRGWTGWAKNGNPVGSVGAGLQLEAVETRLAAKDSLSLPQTNNIYNPKGWAAPDNYSINYSAHVRNKGWIDNIFQNFLGGTTGQAKSLEAVQFKNSLSFSGSITVNCTAYVKTSGWTSSVGPNSNCGTTGQAKSLEAIKLNLSGATASNYDVYYRAHLSELGWQNWVKNDEVAGTPDSGKSIEAIVVKLVQK